MKKYLLISALVATSVLGGMVIAQDAKPVDAPVDSAAPALATQPPETPILKAESITLAKQYLGLVPPDMQIAAVVEKLGARVDDAQKEKYKAIAAETIKADRLTAAAETALAETFTDDELKAMIAFFGTDTGKSVMAKMDAYQQKLLPVVTDMVQQTAKRMQEEGITLKPE